MPLFCSAAWPSRAACCISLHFLHCIKSRSPRTSVQNQVSSAVLALYCSEQSEVHFTTSAYEYSTKSFLIPYLVDIALMLADRWSWLLIIDHAFILFTLQINGREVTHRRGPDRSHENWALHWQSTEFRCTFHEKCVAAMFQLARPSTRAPTRSKQVGTFCFRVFSAVAAESSKSD